ncbi:TFIIA-alpha and beta-like factor [Genypterus blacodes]|uniref:TFIIA-alpha and beta-like factor n=1 Tax=Genypterus blacodes TaxID=154954 RepID=UPI003F7751BB
MLTNTGPVAKLYLSIIDDVIESMRELFVDEGIEDRVLDDLRHLWESKMMQSKAMEDFRKNNINSSNFVLQLPASYRQADQELTVVIPAGQNVRSLPSKVSSGSETLATFSLPAGLAYPVQIPAGVTLQTASGQLYKVNVPVVVTQAPPGQQPFTQPTHKIIKWREGPAPQAAAAPSAPVHPQETKQGSAPATAVTPTPQPKNQLPPNQDSSLPQQPQVPESSQLQPSQSVEPEFPVLEDELSPKPVDLSVTTSSSCSQLLELQIRTEEALAEKTKLLTSDIDEILKDVIEEGRGEIVTDSNPAPPNTNNQSEDDLTLDMDCSYNNPSAIIQLDGAADSSDHEEEEGAALEENDFLGLISAEAMKALDGSSDGNSITSSSDGEGADELVHVEDEDPLNSGDDVIEQDIPDLFDTDNVIVCQYDKIHRSKNRWKFHLKDGVMCYGGRDYVFSKAVGEAEW